MRIPTVPPSNVLRLMIWMHWPSTNSSSNVPRGSRKYAARSLSHSCSRPIAAVIVPLCAMMREISSKRLPGVIGPTRSGGIGPAWLFDRITRSLASKRVKPIGRALTASISRASAFRVSSSLLRSASRSLVRAFISLSSRLLALARSSTCETDDLTSDRKPTTSEATATTVTSPVRSSRRYSIAAIASAMGTIRGRTCMVARLARECRAMTDNPTSTAIVPNGEPVAARRIRLSRKTPRHQQTPATTRTSMTVIAVIDPQIMAKQAPNRHRDWAAAGG